MWTCGKDHVNAYLSKLFVKFLYFKLHYEVEHECPRQMAMLNGVFSLSELLLCYNHIKHDFVDSFFIGTCFRWSRRNG